jgi:hypothetical protein
VYRAGNCGAMLFDARELYTIITNGGFCLVSDFAFHGMVVSMRVMLICMLSTKSYASFELAFLLPLNAESTKHGQSGVLRIIDVEWGGGP